MKLLIAILAAALVAWLLLQRSGGDAQGAAASTSPGADDDELDQVNASAPIPPASDQAGDQAASYSPLAVAIANAEGYGGAGSIPTLANNPGDLELGDLGYGTMQAAGGQKITVFPNVAAGWMALENQISRIFSGRSRYYSPDESLQDFGVTYSGGSQRYGANLANFLGLSPSSTLRQAQG